MERRSVLQLGLAGVGGAAGSLFIPEDVLAGGLADVLENRLAGSIYYTKERPGRWKGKAGGHSPILNRQGNKLEVLTKHVMKPHKHYIVKHVILDDKFQTVGETMFDPLKDKRAISGHDLSKLRNRVYVVSMCNVHDAWVSAIEL